MPSLTDILSRIGTAELTRILGRDIVELLQALDLKNLTGHALADILINQLGDDEVLFNTGIRNEILDALSKVDAERLARLLGLSYSNNPWGTIKACKFRNGSTQTSILFDFFECSYPSPPSDTGETANPKEIESAYSLFPHQLSAARKIWGVLSETDRPRVLLHMPTGAGKTRTAMNIVSEYFRQKAKTDDVVVWLAHSEELCEQAAKEFEKAWQSIGSSPIKLHRFFGAHSSPNVSDICAGFVIASLQLLYKRSLSEQESFLALADKVGLIVMDESHQAIAPTYKHILNLLAAHPRVAILGLSATPGRSWLDAHQDMELARFFNRQKVTLEVEGYDSPISYLQAEGYIARVEYERLPYKPNQDIALTENELECLRTTLEIPESVAIRLGNDARRNLLISERLIQEANKGSKIIVFACSVEHSYLLASILKAKNFQAAAVTSRTTTSRRHQLIEQFRKDRGLQILCNFGILTTGFDAPKTNCAFIVRPTQSVVLFSQMVGRAARGLKAGGNDTCKIVTVVDEIPGFRSVAEAFEYFEEVWQ